MRRLTGALAARLRQESGAIAVFVALSTTVLLAFAAVAIDTSAVRRDQQELRNAADAAALAVALDCAQAAPFVPSAPLPTVCPLSVPVVTGTATRLVSGNAGSGTTVTAKLDGLTVTVTVSADASRPIPVGPGTVSVSSTAEWMPATIGYAATYPLAISECQFQGLATARTPTRLPGEPTGLWLLPPRQEIAPASAAWAGSSSCGAQAGPLPKSVMTPPDAGAACGTSSAKGRDVTGQAFEPIALAARTCVAGSQAGDVTSWPYGGYQVVLPVYDQVRGDQYHVRQYLGFHVMGVTADGGLWGFSTGEADPAQGTPVPSSVRLTA